MSKKARRVKACELAAQVMAGRPDEKCIPQLWSLTVFFERYMAVGAEGTLKDFGPKKRARLKAIK